MSGIPRTLHFVWIGDETKRPDTCFETWRALNPDFELKVWGNDDYRDRPWRTKKHMEAMWRSGQIFGVADLMRWEILLDEGGFALDADSIALQSLPDWLFECTAFACWENELASPGLIANGYFACRPGDPMLSHMVSGFEAADQLATRYVWYKFRHKTVSAWKTVGPRAVTKAYHQMKYDALTILPSHFFCPRHISDWVYRGEGPVYCDQLFGSSGNDVYETLHELTAEQLIAKARARLAATERIDSR